jgi:Co/Zn/Cd efflux system component
MSFDADKAAMPVLMRRTVAIVLALNLSYFFVEYSVAVAIQSVSLFADSIDFLEDATVNGLVLLALGWSAARRRWVGMGLAALLLVPGLAALWTALDKLANPAVPEAFALTITGLGALAINATCALLLARAGTSGSSLIRAAFLSARNDVAANIAIIAAGLVTAVTASIWPDIVVGLGIAALNAGSAWEVYEAAQGETDDDNDQGRRAVP